MTDEVGTQGHADYTKSLAPRYANSALASLATPHNQSKPPLPPGRTDEKANGRSM